MTHSNVRGMQTKLQHQELKINDSDTVIKSDMVINSDTDSLSLPQFLKCVSLMMIKIATENKYSEIKPNQHWSHYHRVAKFWFS